jgi:RING finger protein 113A
MAVEAPAVAPDANSAPVAFKKRSSKAKASFRKRAASPPPPAAATGSTAATAAASDSDSDFTSSDDDQGRKNAVVTASSAANKLHHKLDEDAPEYAAAASLVKSNDATKQTNWYDEAKDTDDLSAKNLLGNTRPKAGGGGSTVAPSMDGTYRGTTNYQSFIQKNPDSAGKQFGRLKKYPLLASSVRNHIKTRL